MTKKGCNQDCSQYNQQEISQPKFSWIRHSDRPPAKITLSLIGEDRERQVAREPAAASDFGCSGIGWLGFPPANAAVEAKPQAFQLRLSATPRLPSRRETFMGQRKRWEPSLSSRAAAIAQTRLSCTERQMSKWRWGHQSGSSRSRDVAAQCQTTAIRHFCHRRPHPILRQLPRPSKPMLFRRPAKLHWLRVALALA